VGGGGGGGGGFIFGRAFFEGVILTEKRGAGGEIDVWGILRNAS